MIDSVTNVSSTIELRNGYFSINSTEPVIIPPTVLLTVFNNITITDPDGSVDIPISTNWTKALRLSDDTRNLLIKTGLLSSMILISGDTDDFSQDGNGSISVSIIFNINTTSGIVTTDAVPILSHNFISGGLDENVNYNYSIQEIILGNLSSYTGYSSVASATLRVEWTGENDDPSDLSDEPVISIRLGLIPMNFLLVS